MMKEDKVYHIKWDGDSEVCQFLDKHVSPEYHSLGAARSVTRAAKELFGVGAQIVTSRHSASRTIVLEG